jgi:hypothetical protein
VRGDVLRVVEDSGLQGFAQRSAAGRRGLGRGLAVALGLLLFDELVVFLLRRGGGGELLGLRLPRRADAAVGDGEGIALQIDVPEFV